MGKAEKNNMYLAKSTKARRLINILIISIFGSFEIFLLLIMLCLLADFNSSVFGLTLFLILISSFTIYLRGRNMLYAEQAMFYSKYFLESKSPYVYIYYLPVFQGNGFSARIKEKYKSNKLKAIKMAIKKGYLVNCTIEIYDGKPRVALAKKVVKDKCQYCGAPIVGVINDSYVCTYCGKRINDVIEKIK